MHLIKAFIVSIFNALRPRREDHKVKAKTILELAVKHNCEYFVETGTYLGDMVEVAKKHFTKVFSVELDKGLYLAAKVRYFRESHVFLVQGDSTLWYYNQT